MELGLLTLGDHRPDPLTGDRSTQAEKHEQLRQYLDAAAPAGFDAVVVGEHHFSDFIVSSPLLFLAWVAARHPTIRLATGVTLLPHHDPVRVAEDLTTLDALSDGRAELWVGKGVEPTVYPQFGQEPEEADDRQDESLRLLIRLMTEREVCWSGRFRPPLDGVTLEPRPVQRPHPPISVACSSPTSAVKTAELGLGLTLTLLAFPRHILARIVDTYRQAWDTAGHGHEPMVTVNCHVHVAPTSQAAYDHLGVYQFPFQRWVFAKKLGLDPDDVQLPPHITELSNPEAGIVCGSPAEVTDRIARIVTISGADRFTYQGDYGGQPWPLVHRSLDLFATEVIPQLGSCR